jgi:hypothetical protein
MSFYLALYRRSMMILVPSLLVVAKWVPYSLINRWNSRTYILRVLSHELAYVLMFSSISSLNAIFFQRPYLTTIHST